jgi:hypothetical protein
VAKQILIIILLSYYSAHSIGIDASIGRLWKDGSKKPVFYLGYYTKKKDIRFYEWGIILRYSDDIGSFRSVGDRYGTIGGMYAAWYIKPGILIFGFGAGSMLANKEILSEQKVIAYTDYKVVPCLLFSLGVGRLFLKISNLFATVGIKIGEM